MSGSVSVSVRRKRSFSRCFYLPVVLAAAGLASAVQAASFAPATTIASGGTPEAWIHMVDMDGDGDGDVLYSPEAGKLTLLRRTGGSYTAVPVIASGVQRVLGAVALDADRDGRLDVAAYVQFSAQNVGVRVVRQLSNGGFFTLSPTDHSIGNFAAPQAPMAVGDFDRDGWPDLAIAWKTAATGTGKGRAGWLRNTTGGAFGTQNTLFFQTYDEPCDVSVSDFNRDGHADILVSDNAANELRLYAGPAFEVDQTTTLPSPPRNVEVVDRNRDGWPDLMVSLAALGSSPGLGLRPWHGSASGFVMQNTFSGITLGPQTSLASADFNLDGKWDFVCGSAFSANAGLYVVYDRSDVVGDAQFTPPVSNPIGAVASGDDDADGDADLVFGTSTGVVRIENTTPHRRIVAETVASAGVAGTAPEPVGCFAAADFNRDGREDVASATSSDGKIRLHLTTATGFTTTLLATFPGCRWISAADMDGDGDMDIVVPSFAADSVHWFANNGSGGGWTGNNLPPPVDLPAGLAVADIDRNGTADAVTASLTEGKVYLLLRSGYGQPWVRRELATVSGVYRIEAADIIPGGSLEIVLQHGSQGAISMLRGAGATWNTVPLVTPAAAANGEGLAIADGDGNGLLDVIYGSLGGVFVMRQTNPAVFTAPELLGHSFEFTFANLGTIRSVRTADCDLDGRPECLAVYDTGVVAFPLREHVPNTLLVRNSAQPQSDIAAIRFNADAVPDLVLRDPASTKLIALRLQAASLSLSAAAANRLPEATLMPIQGQSPVPLMRFSVTSHTWPGDAPVALDRLLVRFRQNNAPATPFDQSLLSITFASFTLYEDLGRPESLDSTTTDPAVAGLQAAAPDAAGRWLFPLTSNLNIPSAGSRTFFLLGNTNTPSPGLGFRVDMPWQASGPNSTAISVVGPESEPIGTHTTTAEARFVAGPPTARQSWRFSHFNLLTDFGLAANFADPDFDGLYNLLEYALGTHPRRPNGPPLGMRLQGNQVAVVFTCVDVQPDTALEIWSSPHLETWTRRASRRPSDGGWDETSGDTLLFSSNGVLNQWYYIPPFIPGGRDYFRLECSELLP